MRLIIFSLILSTSVTVHGSGPSSSHKCEAEIQYIRDQIAEGGNEVTEALIHFNSLEEITNISVSRNKPHWWQVFQRRSCDILVQTLHIDPLDETVLDCYTPFEIKVTRGRLRYLEVLEDGAECFVDKDDEEAPE